MNVFCIGAGMEQALSIAEAKRAGFRVVAADGNPDTPGLRLADEGLVLDIADEDAVIRAARNCAPAFLVPAPIGRLLTTVGAVNDALGLPGISRKAAEACTDKTIFHAMTTAHGLARPRQTALVAKDRTACRKAILDFGLPCIVKPRHGSGKRGVTAVRCKEDIEIAADQILETGGSGEDALIEELVEGAEYGVDAVMTNGRFMPVAVRAKILTPLPFRQEIEYYAPAPLSKPCLEALTTATARCAMALGIDHCFINADVILRHDGTAVVVEIAGRPAGLLIMHKLIPVLTGRNILGEVIAMLGGGAPFPPVGGALRPAALRFLSLPPGILQRVPEPADVRAREGIVAYACDLATGARIEPVTCCADVLARGHVIATGGSAEQARDRAAAILDLFTVATKEQKDERSTPRTTKP